MADSAYELVYRLAQLHALERECDGDVDKVICWWEAAHADSRFAPMLERGWAIRQRDSIRKQLRRAQVKLLVANIAAKRLAEKVVP